MAEIYRWNGKSLWRIWYKDEIVGEVVGEQLAKKVQKALSNNDVGKAIELIRKHMDKPGLATFLHRNVTSALYRLL